MTEIEARINDLVSNFINEITRLARTSALETLERALAGAGGTVVKDVRVAKAPRSTGGGGSSSPSSSSSSSAKRGKGEKRPKAEIVKLQEQVLSHIRSNPGQRIELINKVLGTKTSDLALPLKKLIADGAVDTKGARRATTYFPGDGSAKATGKKRKRAK